MSSVAIAQLCNPPVATALYVPAGTGPIPSAGPQQTTVSSVAIAQLCNPLAVSALKVPAGMSGNATFHPQQVTVSSVAMAQLWWSPEATAL